MFVESSTVDSVHAKRDRCAALALAARRLRGCRHRRTRFVHDGRTVQGETADAFQGIRYLPAHAPSEVARQNYSDEPKEALRFHSNSASSSTSSSSPSLGPLGASCKPGSSSGAWPRGRGGAIAMGT